MFEQYFAMIIFLVGAVEMVKNDALKMFCIFFSTCVIILDVYKYLEYVRETFSDIVYWPCQYNQNSTFFDFYFSLVQHISKSVHGILWQSIIPLVLDSLHS